MWRDKSVHTMLEDVIPFILRDCVAGHKFGRSTCTAKVNMDDKWAGSLFLSFPCVCVCACVYKVWSAGQWHEKEGACS